jgi:uncharacterized protein (TIGR02145 family)
MKKVIYLLASLTLLFSCKKESSTSTNDLNTTNPNTVTCVDNPNINFTSIGTPIGKFGDCIKDIDGNSYKTVTIGAQTWMAENLKTSKYNDGTSIPNIKDSLEWSNNRSGAWCYYNNEMSHNIKYGKLYNWYVTNKNSNGNKNVCPTGWHVPNNNEWDILIKLLGGEEVAGGHLKEIGTSSWTIPNEKTTNISLFTAIPSGGFTETFKYINKGAIFWSAEENTNSNWLAWNASVGYNGTYVDFDDEPKITGCSIRCIKD